MQAREVKDAIAAIGHELGPAILDRCRALLRAGADAIPTSGPVMLDQPYGTHPRQRLDVYVPADRDTPAPVLMWIHGGGFVRGDRRSDDHPFEAHVGRWAAANGFVGVVPSYRLAPDHRWPAGGEDVAAALDWVADHVTGLGGDPSQIVLAGTSAGAVHVVSYLRLRPRAPELRGVILLSGLYGLTPFDERDRIYADDPADFRVPDAVLSSDLPLLVASAQFDPPRFHREFVGLLAALLEARGHLPPAPMALGHNHYTIAMHLGSADSCLSAALIDFARRHTGSGA